MYRITNVCTLTLTMTHAGLDKNVSWLSFLRVLAATEGPHQTWKYYFNLRWLWWRKIWQNTTEFFRICQLIWESIPNIKSFQKKKAFFFFFGNRYGKTRRLLHLIYILKVYCVQEMNIYYAHIKQVNRQWTQPLSFISQTYISSVTQSCLTLCVPKDCSMPVLPVHHQLPEFTQIHVHWIGDAI